MFSKVDSRILKFVKIWTEIRKKLATCGYSLADFIKFGEWSKFCRQDRRIFSVRSNSEIRKNCRSRKHSSEGNGAKWILLRVLAKKASIQPRTRPPKFGTVVFHIKVRISGIPTYNLVDDYIKSGHRYSIRSQSKCLTTR